ncbi:CRISPR-associated endonuclease Cas2 [Saccharolobus sp.]|uniref:CRISPR-associated endonuclease Cas2 n=1 Tax=Saccharolobus sp. TaxID=2100761 RepID=UPI00386FC21E
MYVIVAFDISDEHVRGRLRRFLRSLGLSMVNRSVYAGAGGQSIAERVKEKANEILGDRDSVFIILVTEGEYNGAILCTSNDCEKIGDRTFEIY